MNSKHSLYTVALAIGMIAGCSNEEKLPPMLPVQLVLMSLPLSRWVILKQKNKQSKCMSQHR